MTGRLPDVMCVSSIDWDFIWQGHQEIMSRMAAEGHRVLFVENTGVRAPKVRDLPRVRQRIRNWWRGTKGFRQERPNLFIYSPLLLPLPYFWLARWINRTLLARNLRRWMEAVGFSRPILWTFLPTPLALDLIRAVDPQVTIYYCIDDLQSSSAGARKIVTSEERLFRTADLVFCTSEKLRERAARYGDHVHLFPFGVNLERFDAVRNAASEPPPDLKPLRKPVIGYVGGLHQWVDQPLLAAVAERLPEMSFALVGPLQTDVSALERRPNVTLFGQRDHADLPKYVKAFDVGIVPYLLTEYTANVYPTKLNEYLSMGIPVVATDLPEIRRFNRDHGDVVQVAATADAFAAAIRQSLDDESTPAVITRRVEVAQSNSWGRRIAAMSQLIDGAIARRSSSDQRWDQALRRIYRRTRAHVAEVVVGLVVAYLLAFQTNLIWRVGVEIGISEVCCTV
jgi:glycosyltransferase involved in cell wall biosynthesis